VGENTTTNANHADPTTGEVVEWFREMVFEYFVARLPRRAVGYRGISPDLHPDGGRVARKRGATGRDGQRSGRFTARIAIPKAPYRLLLG
jgi:hypothetical protein